MKSIYDSRQRLKFVFIFTAILIAIASLVVSDMLIKDLAQEERQKMEVWAEATRLTASKNTAVDLSLVLKIRKEIRLSRLYFVMTKIASCS